MDSLPAFAVGVDLGGTTIKAALVERGVGIQHELSRPTEAEEGPAHVIGRIAEMVQTLIRRAPDHQIAGIGIGAPGTVNWERTAVVYPPNLPGWGIVDLRKALQEALGIPLPVFVENDANLAGLGSAHYGAGRPFDAFIMVTLGTGVGGAIIYRNRIFRGTTGGAGEIGHMSIDYEGPLDRYGIAGSIEAYIGQRFLSRYARYRLLTQRHSLVHQMAGEDLRNLTPRLLYEAARAGDEPAREVLAWAGHKLGCVLASAVNLLDIHKIVVGGGVSAADRFILEPARQTLRRYVIPALRDKVEIIRETLGNEAGMLGAAQLVFQLLEHPSEELEA
ncbi:ROK family protein [Rhodothermus profundi]|uniref:Glucokinase n=1 Tax=Rhodothermus profundi TaxID=633813 RepID=A0A1M6V9E8_9BACT|nr:ROK family protein [Rhodothermus profundi]SHK78133.1 glucokinase [Rhodothermus profundi]